MENIEANLDNVPFEFSECDYQLKKYFRNLDACSQIDFDVTKPLRWYLRSAELVFKQAMIYKTEKNIEKAYILLLKFSKLVIKKIPNHPEYNSDLLQKSISNLKISCLYALKDLEEIKGLLKDRFFSISPSLFTNETTRNGLTDQGSDINHSWQVRYQKIQEFTALESFNTKQIVQEHVIPVTKCT